MSSPPLSLPFSSSVQQAFATASLPSRNSLGSQLPLPSSLSAPMSQRPPVGVTVSSTAGPSSPTLPGRSLTITHRPSSPPMHSYPTSFPVHSSSTHAGGIQPSASFFHPSRPNNHPQYSRPTSPSSSDGVHTQGDGDQFQLSQFGNQNGPNSSEERVAESIIGGPESMMEDQNPYSFSKRLKQSREPLLPIGGQPTNMSSRPSPTRARSGSNTVSPPTPTRSTTRMMRNSLDKVFSLSRGLSFDSMRRVTNSNSQHMPSHSIEERPVIFERKLSDEEQAMTLSYPNSPVSPTRYRHPPSHMRYTGQSLSVSASRHSAAHSAPSASPEPSFIHVPPNHATPLSAVPRVDEKTRKFIRNYQLHPSRNRFFIGGRVLTGGDSPWAFIASFGLVLSIAGVWFATTCVWWWHNESPAVAGVGAYMALLTISSMLATALCDPGILPRNLDPDPPYPATSPSDGIRVPMPRDLKVRSDVVRVKYCATCKTYRPPRSSHCKMCDNCVDSCDHHCQWVNNCVGRRNYTYFFVLLMSATLTLILIICTSTLHLFFLTRRENLDFKHALRRGAGSAVAFCLSIAVIWPVAALLSYHLRLLLFNITTIEQIRNQAHKSLVPGPPPPNPFSHGSSRRNIIAVLCRPQGPSWLNGPGIATEDKREINPGLIDNVWDGTAHGVRDPHAER